MTLKPICRTCGKEAQQIHGTISRRWKCNEHGSLGGDRMVEWKEMSE